MEGHRIGNGGVSTVMNGQPRFDHVFLMRFSTILGVCQRSESQQDEIPTPASAGGAHEASGGCGRLWSPTVIAVTECCDAEEFDTAEELYVRLTRPNDVGCGRRADQRVHEATK